MWPHVRYRDLPGQAENVQHRIMRTKPYREFSKGGILLEEIFMGSVLYGFHEEKPGLKENSHLQPSFQEYYEF